MDINDTFIKIEKYISSNNNFKSIRIKKHLEFLVNDLNRKQKKRNRYYKQGTFIKVDFGVNCGNELSGEHFAITLNKNDTSFKNIVTVIPLSSKNKKQYFDIGVNFFEEIVSELAKQRTYIDNGLDMMDIYLADFYRLVSDNHKKELSDHELDLFLKSITPFIVDKEIKPSDDKMLTLIDCINALKYINIRQKKESKDLGVCVAAYQKYLKNSFAICDNIVTISKRKIIMPINDFDPIGKIKLKDNVLDELTQHIIAKLL